LSLKVIVFEVPPPGAGLNTVISNGLAEAKSSFVKSIVRTVELTYVTPFFFS